MGELRLRLDPSNPGQFYACCGVFEVATALAPGLAARFDCDENRPRAAEFIVAGDATPDAREILGELRKGFEALEHEEEAVRPVRITIGQRAHDLDWWLDEFREETVNLKCWAGQVTTRKLFDELPALIDPAAAADNPLAFPAMTKSKFGVDPRAAWNALDFGYSPNAHNQDAATYPVVEVLAAIGLEGFRPDAGARSKIGYSLWTIALPLPVARLAATWPWDGLPRFDYQFDIDKRGQSYKYFTFGQFQGMKGQLQ